MGRIGLALALLSALSTVAHATAEPCMQDTITFGDRTIERGQLVYGRIEPRWKDSTDKTPPAGPKDALPSAAVLD